MIVDSAIFWRKHQKMDANKLETFEDALFEGSKTSTHKTEKLDADLLPCGNGMRKRSKVGLIRMDNELMNR